MTFQEGGRGAWVFLAPSALRLPSYAFYHISLNGATASKVKNFERLPLSSYPLEIWGNIFQVLEAEAQQTPIILPEGIMREKGESIKAKKQPIHLIETAPEDLSINE